MTNYLTSDAFDCGLFISELILKILIDYWSFKKWNHVIFDVIGQLKRLLRFCGDCSFKYDEHIFERIFSDYEFANVVCKFIQTSRVKDLRVAYFS